MKVLGISIDCDKLTLTTDHIDELKQGGLAVGLTHDRRQYIIYNQSKPLPILKADTTRLKNMLSRVRSDVIYNGYNDELKIEHICKINEQDQGQKDVTR